MNDAQVEHFTEMVLKDLERMKKKKSMEFTGEETIEVVETTARGMVEIHNVLGKEIWEQANRMRKALGIDEEFTTDEAGVEAMYSWIKTNNVYAFEHIHDDTGIKLVVVRKDNYNYVEGREMQWKLEQGELKLVLSKLNPKVTPEEFGRVLKKRLDAKGATL